MVTDRTMERIISRLLRWGVTIASALTLVGGIVFLFQYGGSTADYRIFSGEPEQLRSITGILRAAFTLHGRGLIQAGLLLLILTPVTRVAFSLAAFIVQRDFLYALVTLIVFAILLFGLAVGM